MEAIATKLLANLPLIALTVAILIGVPVAYRAWLEAHEDDEPADPIELLSDLERAYFMGEIDADELSRVKAVLIGRRADPVAPAGRVRPLRPEPPTASPLPRASGTVETAPEPEAGVPPDGDPAHS